MFEGLRGSKEADEDSAAAPFLIGEWKLNAQARTITCSEECCRLLGIPKETETSSLQEKLLDRVHPSDRALVSKYWKLVAEGRITSGATFRFFVKKALCFLYSEMTAEYDESGKLITVAVKTRNITDYIVREGLFPQNSERLSERNFEHAVVHVDREFRIVRVSPMAEKLLGWKERDLRLQLPDKIIPTIYQDSMKQLHGTIMKHGGTMRLDTAQLRKDGSLIHVGILLAPLRDLLGAVVGVSATYSDPFNKSHKKTLASEIEKRVQALVQNSIDVSMILSKDNHIQYVTPAVKNVLGYNVDEFIAGKLKNLIYPEDWNKQLGIHRKLLEYPTQTMDAVVRIQHKNGEWRYCAARLRYLNEFCGTDGIIVNFHDITEIRQAQEILKTVASRDFLTFLPNRKSLEEQLELLIGVNKGKQYRLAVLLLGIRRLRYINFSLGRSIADQVVKNVAEKLESIVQGKGIVSRSGEDEFSVLLPSVKNTEDTVQLAKEIIRSFGDPFLIGMQSLFVSASAGISVYPDDGRNVETLLKSADIALHTAQLSGPGQVHIHSQDLNAKTYKEFTLSNDFRSAVQNQEFVVHFQPRVDANTGAILAAEALIRWEHPKWGIVAPAEFLYLAEQTGFIVPIGEWILRTTCEYLNVWKQRGYPDIRVSVNFSVQQLLGGNVVNMVQTILNKYRIDPQFLEIEITETSALPDEPQIVASIKAFRAMGINIFFDDFGTGYSALSWLYQFELDGIKLDKAFIGHLPDHAVPTEIVTSVVNLAHSLGLTVVAEGVETKRQLNFLAGIGCDQIQGYLFSKPVPAEEFENLLLQGNLTVNEKTDNAADLKSPGNRRKYFRVNLRNPMQAEMTIAKLDSQPLSIGYSDILISDIGPGGLRMITNLRLPVHENLLLRFRIFVLERVLEPYGHVVWKDELPNELFQYGIEFQIDDTGREELIRIFNDLEIHLRRGIDLPGTKFYTQNTTAFFN